MKHFSGRAIRVRVEESDRYLVVMEEAHRYLSTGGSGTAQEIVQRIVKEGRKYGIGAMIVSQRPSEVDETILSQCGTFIALRLSNPSDRV